MYYYLVASLPLLSLDAERLWTDEEFLEACRGSLSPRDYRVVAAASLRATAPAEASCPSLELWRAWETALRGELASLRGKRAGREPGGEPGRGAGTGGPAFLTAQGAARSAFAQESPLQAEEILDRARWAHLDDLEVGHHFDVDKVVLYRLRLQLLRRRALRDPARGERRFAQSYEAITKPIHGSA